MSDETSLSEEQAELLDSKIDASIEVLLATGRLEPTLCLHDGQETVSCRLAAPDVDSLREEARRLIEERMPGALAYALLYDSSLRKGERPEEVLLIETGDDEEDRAVELGVKYTRATKTSDPDLTVMDEAPHLLRHPNPDADE